MDFPINSRTSSQPPNKQEISQLAMFEYQNVPSLAMPRLCPSWRAPGAADIGRRSDGIPPAARLRGRPPEHHVIICYPPRVRFQSAKNFNSTARTDIYSTKSGDTTLPKLELVSIFDFFGGQSPRHGRHFTMRVQIESSMKHWTVASWILTYFSEWGMAPKTPKVHRQLCE